MKDRYCEVCDGLIGRMSLAAWVAHGKAHVDCDGDYPWGHGDNNDMEEGD